MSKLNRIKQALENLLLDFSTATSDKGVIAFEGDIEEGTQIELVDENGNRVEAEDGDYKVLETGFIYTVAHSKVTAINEIKDEDEDKDEEPETDGKENKKEDKKEEEKMSDIEFMKEKEKFEASYDEKTRKIAALVGQTYSNAYVFEAADDYCIVEAFDETINDYRYFKFDLSWVDDEPQLGTPIEVKRAFVPVALSEETPAPNPAPNPEPENEETTPETTIETEAPEDKVEEPEVEKEVEDTDEVKELKSTIDSLKAEIEALKKTPVANPVSDDYDKASKTEKTGNKGLDRAVSIFGAKFK